MAVEDEVHTSFITLFRTYYCVHMPFGLRNAGATFVGLVQIVFEAQVGQNVEAYIDDIVVKSKKEKDLLIDLREIFSNLHRIGICLNIAKCTFGVCSGKLLGYLVSQRSIEANPNKIRAIRETEPLTNLRKAQHLTCNTPLQSLLMAQLLTWNGLTYA
ncbi:unnamed protein product [Urochloa humidicola]